MEAKIIKGDVYEDNRGKLCFNNSFDASEIKRIYTIEHPSTKTIRGWQGHKIQKRWFSVLLGSFEIKTIAVDNWTKPNKFLKQSVFQLNNKRLDFLQIPPGYITSIQALENNSKLLVLADYRLDDTPDEYRFELNYFK
jgi:dTDP-4-dehydrorhamnose 3,5-epimerase-like enzyme